MQDIVKKLHPLERKVLGVLKKKIGFKELVIKSKLKEIEVLRALSWLKNKGALNIKEEIREVVELDKNGEEAVKKGLPERRVLDLLKEKSLGLKEIVEKLKLDKNEVNVSIGVLKKNNAVLFDKGVLSLTDRGKKLQKKSLFGEEFLKELPLNFSKLTDEEKLILEELKKRRELIKISDVKLRSIELTSLGEKLINIKLKDDSLEAVTPDMLKKQSWKNKEFRYYDLNSITPRLYNGKRHFVNQAIDYIRKIWLEMGFEEMKGNLIQTSFWNFDALFTAQDHPVRDMQDTFFIKKFKGNLPKDERIVNRVKAAHESGKDVESKGWGYKWNEEEAKKLVLRTHTTCLSAKTLSKLKNTDLPAKFFSVGKVFRNEALDWSHLFEFYQVEGIIVDYNANFKHLLGYLKQYYDKLGFKDIKFRPAYFPYTEMSVEPIAYDKERGVWVELGGAGILREEVVKPLFGDNVTVLAFGQGMERAIKDYYKIGDIRKIYNNDLKMLRESKMWLK